MVFQAQQGQQASQQRKAIKTPRRVDLTFFRIVHVDARFEVQLSLRAQIRNILVYYSAPSQNLGEQQFDTKAHKALWPLAPCETSANLRPVRSSSNRRACGARLRQGLLGIQICIRFDSPPRRLLGRTAPASPARDSPSSRRFLLAGRDPSSPTWGHGPRAGRPATADLGRGAGAFKG